MTFIQICRNIQELVPEVSILVIKQRVKIRYQQILKMREWEFLRKTTLVATAAEYETGTLSILSGTITATGSGTTFTSAMAGRSLIIGTTQTQPYTISSVDSITNLTLDQSFASATDSSGDSFSIKALRYTPAVNDIARIESIIYDEMPLIEKPIGYFDSIDPDRTTTGDPVYYTIVGKSAMSGTITFEIHPVPDAEYVLKIVYYRKVSDTIVDSDTLIVDAELLEAGALWDCYRIFSAKNPAYIGLARDARGDYQSSIALAIEQDLEQSSLPSRVKDVSEMGSSLLSDVFQLDHDTEW
uniref:Uncharacterized protein n=1 Tax=viral metagenome TaxID=1070528 RepID=A0A6M3L282_9ZZZZ